MAKHTKSRAIDKICRDCGSAFVTGSSIKFHCSVECRLRDLAKTFSGTDGCWNWDGSINPQTGYGQLSSWEDGKRVLYTTHRMSFRAFVGDIPIGKFVCHTCDNRKCFNPSHLFIGSQHDNMLDCKGKGRNINTTNPKPEINTPKKFAMPSGKDHPMWGKKNKQGADHHLAKVDDAAVMDIRSSKETLKVVAERYGISQTNASYIRRGKTWKHVLQSL